MNILKINIIISIMILAVIISSNAALGWGIAYPGNDFTIMQGQTQDVRLNIQNHVGDETKKITIDFEGDYKIASIVDKKEYYILPVKSSEDVILRFSIPEKAKKEYHVDVKFTAHSIGSGVTLSTAKILSFNIDIPDGVLSEEEDSQINVEEEEPGKTDAEIKQELREILGEEEGKGGVVVAGGGIGIGLTFGIVAIIAVVVIAIVLFMKKRKKGV